MKAKWTVNPEFSELDKFIELSQQYDAAFEYTDFTFPHIYQNKEETKRRIEAYNALDRDRSRDTLHGVFFDVAFLSTDDVLRARSRELMDMSLDIARELNCKGVVFHSGIIGGLNVPYYFEGWVKGMCEFLPTVAERYKDINIYLENTVESSASEIVEVAARLKGLGNVKLCLDYAHASIRPRKADEWIRDMAPYVGHMHVNDNDLQNDLHLACGEGNIDFNHFAAEVDYYGLDTSIVLEVTGYDRARRSLEFMSKL
ncbi:MAG: sugar phosphate isomerase/epimerase [Lachnospiraceae bacterium]|nr:sugar phosphate isomerase/epimerase [Lachnospiraceae bacterium]